MDAPVHILLSYARKDESFLRQLEAHLSTLERSGRITIWHQQKIKPGKVRSQEIKDHLDSAQVIFLLISPHFLASEPCYLQLQRAMERLEHREAFVVPILLRPCTYEDSPLAQLQMLPSNAKPITNWANRDEAFAEVVRHFKKVLDRKELLELREQLQPPIQHSSRQQETGDIPDSSSQANQKPAYRNVIKQPSLLHSRTILKRTQIVKEVYKRLTQPETTALILTGIGGIGKSVLANQVYSYASNQQQAGKGPFSGEPLWIDIDATVTLVDVVGSLSEILQHPTPYFHSFTAKDLAAEFFRLLQITDSAPRLVVLNQFETWLDPQTHRARHDLPGVGEWLDILNSQWCSSRILLTSHFFPHGAYQSLGKYVQKYDVKGLSESEGMRLLRMGGIQAKREELLLAVTHYQGHTMALTILRSLLVGKQHIHIADLLNDPLYKYQWTSEMSKLLHYIYTQQLKPEQRALLLAFSVFREAVPVQAALTIVESSFSANRAGAALQVLLNLCLLQSSDTLCYQLHPVVADFREAYIVDNSEQNEEHMRRAAHIKAARYYKDLSMHNFPPKVQPQSVNDIHYLIEAAWHLCQGEHKQAAYLLIQEAGLFFHLHRWGNNSILLELYTQLLSSDEWKPETMLAAHLHNEMGEIYSALGLKNEAQRSFMLALKHSREGGLAEHIVKTLNNLGAVYRVLGQYIQALDCYQEALSICDESINKIIGHGETLNNLGIVSYEQGYLQEQKGRTNEARAYYQQALTYYEQALTLHQENELQEEEANTLNNIGDVYIGLEQSDEAYEFYWRALKCFQKCKARRGEGLALNNLGVLSRELGKEATAQKYYIQALRIFREIGDRWQEGKVLRNLGRWYFLQETLETSARYSLCLAHFLLARDMFEEIHKPRVETIPDWIENSMRAELGPQQFAALLTDSESRAASIVEQALHEDE